MSYSEITINEKQIKLIPLGECACGCGGKTNIPKYSNRSKKWLSGRPLKVISGHQNRRHDKKDRTIKVRADVLYDNKGYALIYCKGHNRAHLNGYGFEHILQAEKVFGKPLPSGAIVHHANGSTTGPLVICQDRAYHSLLHRRMRAYESCGDPHWVKCEICGKYDDPDNLNIHRNRGWHRKCHNERMKNYYRTKKGK